ncbi:HlyD family efflux transporter periplasmic adaptor subunit [Streptomyces sp. L7]
MPACNTASHSLGEVLAGGGRLLNLVDLSDVYMTFFVPETDAGRIAMGSEVRIVLDAAPQFVIPARVSFVASTAQFTPKTVETASERQADVPGVKAQIDPRSAAQTPESREDRSARRGVAQTRRASRLAGQLWAIRFRSDHLCRPISVA